MTPSSYQSFPLFPLAAKGPEINNLSARVRHRVFFGATAAQTLILFLLKKCYRKVAREQLIGAMVKREL